jgi:predicted ATP-dependent endonuclease of OLD family
MMTRQHARRHFDEIRSDSGGLPPLRYLFPSEALAKVSKELISELETILVEEKSYEDFSSAVQTLETRIQEDATRVQEEPIRNKIGTFAGEESSIPDYVRNILHGISEMKVLYLKEQRKSMGKKEADRLLSLKTRRGGAEDLRNIQETVSALLGVQIDAFQSESRSRRGETTAEMDVDNFLVEVNGSGIREALRIVLDIEFEHPNILLIEEPEIHLHPSLETSMMRYLKRVSPDCQVFIATHSTNFLDTGEMKNVYLVSKPDSTRIQLLDYEEAEAQIPRELGIRLSSLFMFDRLVFVEGPSDETILREWAFSKSNVGFIHMEGARNFTHFATKATLSVLTKRQVQMWFIMDRDERDDAEIDKLKEIAGENAVVKVLERREIENYLICHRAIIEFIELKRELSGNRSEHELPTESDVKNTIEGCAEKLKHRVIDKRVANILCRPVYPSTEQLFESSQETTIADRVTGEIQRLIEQLRESGSKAEAVYKEESEYVDRTWQSDKLAIVPGDLLLDMVCQKYGVRFNKDRDGERLAALMNEGEIAMDVKETIHEIGGERSGIVQE